MKNLLCFLLFFTCLHVLAQGTSSINGIVSDEKGAPLPGATVFITNSKYAQPTDADGKFSFTNLQPGTYEVVVKMMGFKPGAQRITLNGQSVNIIINLKESNIVLNGITINGKPDPNREKYLAWFIKNFIGETINSQQCKLLNPGIIRFHLDKDTNILTASADDFLLVENKALGYQLKYLLNDFEIDLNHGTGYYNGYPYFEDMKGSETQQKRWESNRREAYLSSGRHFFRAVANNTADDEGFMLYQITDDPEILKKTNKNTPRIEMDDNLVALIVPDIKSFFSEEAFKAKSLAAPRKIIGKDTTSRTGLFVVYKLQDQPLLFYRTGHPIKYVSPKKGKVSRVHLFTDKLMIDRNGILSPEEGYKFSGYWAWQRIADLTPFDYFGEGGGDEKKLN